MIIDNNYFKGEIYIPRAQKSVSDDIMQIDSEVEDFINQYEEDCLIKCLGVPLYLELKEVLDENNDNLLVEDVDSKWDLLLNGDIGYTSSSGKKAIWKGIRFRQSENDYYKSFLAYYVYFYHESNAHISNTGVGHNINKPKNAETVSPTFKSLKAYRKFFELVVGRQVKPNIVYRNGLISRNYSINAGVKSLHEYIEDVNKIDGRFSSFEKGDIKNLNFFGI